MTLAPLALFNARSPETCREERKKDCMMRRRRERGREAEAKTDEELALRIRAYIDVTYRMREQRETETPSPRRRRVLREGETGRGTVGTLSNVEQTGRGSIPRYVLLKLLWLMYWLRIRTARPGGALSLIYTATNGGDGNWLDECGSLSDRPKAEHFCSFSPPAKQTLPSIFRMTFRIASVAIGPHKNIPAARAYTYSPYYVRILSWPFNRAVSGERDCRRSRGG